MRNHYFCLPLSFAFSLGLQAQTVLTPAEYDDLKAHGELPAGPIVISATDASQGGPAPWVLNRGGGACDCWIAPDANYQAAIPAENDDMSSEMITLPFSFELLGEQYNTLYVNNNGNISFATPYGTYTATGFPSENYIMIAPFWADVDTRDTTGGGDTWLFGQVLYRVTSTALYVNWVDVGYYSMHGDKRNSFQLIITDGTDPVIPGGNNVSFCYQDMQWTTGDASGGIDGFLGYAATAGVNRGNGIDHAQIGRYSMDSDVYNGPYLDSSGVSWLDSTHFYLSTAGVGVPPVFGSTFGCDTVMVQMMGGQDRDQSVRRLFVLPGGPDQLVSCVSDAPSLPNFEAIDEGPAPYLDLEFAIDGSDAVPGVHYITFTATNDDLDPLSSEYVLEVHVLGPTGLAHQEQGVLGLQPTLATDRVMAQWPAGFQARTIELLTIDGRVLGTWVPWTHGPSHQLNVSALPSGEYLVRVTGQEGPLLARFTRLAE